jgi:hypothetical protein
MGRPVSSIANAPGEEEISRAPCLTQACTGPSLLMMRVAKTILVVLALAALFAYALDWIAQPP